MDRARKTSFKSILCVLSVAFAGAQSTASRAGPGDDGRPAGWPNLSRQFVFGFEPTHTNLSMVFDSAYAVLKKALTGRGKGVLEIEGRSNTAARAKYLSLLRQNCPECVIMQVRESHGTISYRVTYPDRSTIGSSLDAGALEWQNSPLSLDEIHANHDRHQRHMFDLPKQAGAWMNLDALGGHVTESGYDDPLFWLASLKLDAETPVMSWGFFGKDGYNATPVKRWAADQQAQYQRVIHDYEAQWVVFMKELESLFRDPAHPPSAVSLREAFARRRIMDRKTLAKKLAEIYYNPDQESPRTGKRSKPKYVAHRPAAVGNGILIIENRAVRPQKEARDLELMARYRLRRAEFIKYWLDQGYDVDFSPGYFEDVSDQAAAAQARAFLEELGLKWSDYAHLGPVKNPRLSGSETALKDRFTRKPYGVSRRDRLFKQVLDSFYARSAWSSDDWSFLLALTEEQGTTVERLKSELRRMMPRFESSGIEHLPILELNQRVASLLGIVDKFRSGSPELFEIVSGAVYPALDRLLSEGRVQDLAGWVRHLPDGRLVSWVERGQSILRERARAVVFDLQASLIDELAYRKRASSSAMIRNANIDYWILEWFRAFQGISRGVAGSAPRSLPRSLGPMCDQARGLVRLREALGPLAEYWLSATNRIVRDSDETAIEILAREFPEYEDAITAPLRERYWQELRLRKFGEEGYYEAIVLSDKLLGVTPIQERESAARELLSQVQEMHARVNSPDSKSFVERLTKELGDAAGVACQASISPGPLRRFRDFLLSSFKRL